MLPNLRLTPFAVICAAILLPLLFTACKQKASDEIWIALPPADSQYCAVAVQGTTIIPNGRFIRPMGKTYRIAPHPFGLALSPDGTVAVTANSGTRPFSITLLKDVFGNPVIKQIPEGADNDAGLLESVFMGLAISPDNQKVYVAGGQSNKIFVFDLNSGAKTDSISCAAVVGDRDYTHGYIGDMALTRDGKTLYAVDQIGFRLLAIDVASRKVMHHIPTGRYPFGVTLTPDEKRVLVANVGQFEYKPFPFVDPKNLKGSSIDYPAFGYNTPEMRDGTTRDSLDLPGLGDPNAPEAFSVWVVETGEQPRVSHKIKTGFLVGDMVEGIPAVGGASPNSLVCTDTYAFVSNGNNDLISVIDLKKDTVVKNIPLTPDPRLKRFRGVIPFGLAVSPDQKRLYVAESGLNAVAVVDIPSLSVIGHLPVGWFPSKVKVSPDGKRLVVANAKGYGSGPNGGKDFQPGPEGSYVGALMKGSVTTLVIPTDDSLKHYTQQVLDNNFRFVKPTDPVFAARKSNPVPLYPGEKTSPIKYIVFISKENRTYDEVFGQLKKGNGDATLARYGLKATFTSNKGTDTLRGIDVMPNHIALARRYAISDNFYVDSDHSADGHRWLVSTYPNEWVEASVPSAYGGGRRFRADSKAPGNPAFVGASGAIYPEDYNEHGSLWDHLSRNQIPFFNFGFGMELAGTYDDSTLKHTGVRYLVNFPVPGPLFDHSSKSYPTYNMAIPDQYRADEFIREVKANWLDKGAPLPRVLTVLLPNDHGAGERAHAGFPYRESYMMDNDLALGRIVEFLSQTPYWKEMAIVVTEDDAQNGVDHIDAHRSLLMVISPYAKRDHVSHMHASFGSIFKTFWNVLSIPHLNQYDAAAHDLHDLFTSEPDFTPYFALPVDARVFDPVKALNPFDEGFDWKAVIESPNLDDPEYLLQEAKAADKRRELERNRLSNPRTGKED